MELVYLWVEDYKNIKKQGFNFSPRFDCKFDGKTLTIEKKEHVHIFPENINVTAIVGENGSGKSSLLEIFQSLFVFNSRECEEMKNTKYILVTKDNELSLNLFSNIDTIDHSIDTLKKNNRENLNLDCIFYDSELPYNNYNTYEFASENFAVIPVFEYIKQKLYIDLNPFNISEKLLSLKNTFISDIFTPSKINITPKKHTDIKTDLINYEIHKKGLLNNETIKLIDDILMMDLNNDESFYIHLLISGHEIIEENKLKEHLKEIKKSKSKLNTLEKIFKEYYNNKYKKRTLEELKKLCKIKEIENLDLDKLQDYEDYIDINLIDKEGKTFDSLSHGEKVYFALQLSIFHKLKNTNDGVFIFLDEPDLALHPKWQKKYISLLIKVFKNFNNKIHLILTSHSPFFLSDLPKKNILFLDKYKNDDDEVKQKQQEAGNCKNVNDSIEIEQTFGANIHTLLSHGFFMKDGLMGEFAKEEINEVIKLLKDDKKELSQNEIKFCKKIVSIIGEPILQRTLQSQLDMKLYPKETELEKLEREQKELQEKIDELKKKKNETN